MKRVLFVLLLCMSGFVMSFAQNLQEVVYLKNGSVIKGVVIEQVPGESLKIQTSDGSIFAYKMSEVEKITKENIAYRNGMGFQRNSNFDGNGVKIGYRGFINLGYTVGTGTFGIDRVEFNTSHGYQFCPYFYVGLGTGVHYYYDAELVEIPIYADFRADILNHWITPYVDLKVGYTVYDSTGFYLSPTVGCRFGFNEDLALNLGIGYTMQKLEFYYGRLNCGGFNIKLGVEF